jgi:hypothetical protein
MPQLLLQEAEAVGGAVAVVEDGADEVVLEEEVGVVEESESLSRLASVLP